MTYLGSIIIKKHSLLRFRKIVFYALCILPFLGGVNSGELPLLTLIRFLMVLVLGVVLVADYINSPYEIRFNRYYLLYLFYSGFTIFWAPNTAFFAYKYLEVILLYCLFYRFSEGFKESMVAIKNILLLNVILSIIFLNDGFNLIDSIIPYQLRGAVFTLNPNDFGFLACLILLWKFTNRAKYKVQYLFWFAVLILTQSRIYVGFLIVLSVLFMVKRKPLLLGITSLALFSSALPHTILSFFQRSKSIEDMSSLNGRVGFWELGIKHWLESPIFGHGWYTGHRFTRSIGGVPFDSNTFDSTVIDLLADVGIVGLLLVVMMFFTVYKNSKIRLLTLALILKSLIGPSIQVLHPSLLVLYIIMLYGKNGNNMPNLRLQSAGSVREIT